jgi:hypothetical protein
MGQYCHPAYPTVLQLQGEDRAILRDGRDRGRLAACADLVGRSIDALIPLLGRLEHPRARWCPDDLMDCLIEHAADIKAEQQNLTGPVMIDDDD